MLDLGLSCGEIDPQLGILIAPAYLLSAYAWRFRYPGSPFDPSEPDVREALELAERVQGAILARLPDRVWPDPLKA